MMGSALIGNLSRVGLVMILSRYYSKEEFGIWAAITSTAAVMATGDFGIINSLRNKMSELIVKGEEGLKVARQYFYSAFIFFTLFSLLLSLLLYIGSHYFSFEALFKTDNELLKKQGVLIMLWIQFLFFMNIPLSMGGACFFSFHEAKYSAFFSTLQSLMCFIVVLLCAVLKLSIVTISIGYFVVNALFSGAGTIYFIYRRKWFNYTFVFKEFYSQLKELFSTGIKFMGLHLANSFLQNAGTIFASSFLGVGIAAEFNMVQKVYGFFVGIYQSIFNPIWGGYSEAAFRGDWKWCKKTLNISVIVSFVIFTSVIGIMYFFGNFFLVALAGKGYISNHILFLLLGVGSMFFILFSSASTMQTAVGKINVLLILNLIGAFLIVPFCKFFAFRYSVNGVATAIAIQWFIMFVITYIYSYIIVKKNIALNLNSYE